MSSNSRAAEGRRQPEGGAWIVTGESVIGYNARVRGVLPGPLTIVRPGRKMIAINCDRCFRRHDNANMACSATSGCRAEYMQGQIYSVATGKVLKNHRVTLSETGKAFVHPEE